MAKINSARKSNRDNDLFRPKHFEMEIASTSCYKLFDKNIQLEANRFRCLDNKREKYKRTIFFCEFTVPSNATDYHIFLVYRDVVSKNEKKKTN